MLPKSDQQQIYLWMDLARDANVEKSKEVVRGVNGFLSKYYAKVPLPSPLLEGEEIPVDSNSKYPKKSSIIKNISRRVGIPPMLDFSNLFRGSQSRMMPYQVSARINLTHSSKRSWSSEKFVMALRPALQEFLDENYPSVEMRLLEDPPGPPVRATFLLEFFSDEIAYDTLVQEANRIEKKLAGVMKAYNVADIGVSDDGWQTKYVLKLDHQLIAQAGLTAEQIGATL